MNTFVRCDYEVFRRNVGELTGLWLADVTVE